jgi:hypothetical protein
MKSMVDYLAQYNIKARGTAPGSYGMVWLDIEGAQPAQPLAPIPPGMISSARGNLALFASGHPFQARSTGAARRTATVTSSPAS